MANLLPDPQLFAVRSRTRPVHPHRFDSHNPNTKKLAMKYLINTIRPFVLAPVVVAVAALGLLSLSACDLLGGSERGSANVRVLMVDNPFPFDLVAEANVEISRVELIGEDDHYVIMDETRSYNLLELRDGVSALLGEVDLPIGTYAQARFIVESAEVVMNDEQVYDLKVPSGSETGIKVLLNDLVLEDGQDVTITMDFDVEQSFIALGNIDTPTGINGFIFTPVIVPKSIVVAEVDATTETDPEGDEG